MSKRRQDNWEDIAEKISLSQKIAADHPEFEEYSGSDIFIARKIAKLNVFLKHGLIKPSKKIALYKDLLVEEAKAILASSEKTDIVTKLGFRRGQKEDVYGRLPRAH